MNLLIFDIDGTLTDTKKVDDHCFIKAFEKVFGLDIAHYNWSDLKNVTDWGITEEIVLQHFNRLPTPKEYEMMISKFLAELELAYVRDKSQFIEVPGAKVFFETVQKALNLKVGIATGAWEQSAKFKLKAIGIDPNQVVFSNSNYHKSRMDISNHVIQQLKAQSAIEPDSIIYFGDGKWDYETCQSLGIQFIGIDVKGDNQLSNLGAQTVFRNFLEKQKILEMVFS